MATQKEVADHLGISVKTLNIRLKDGILPQSMGIGGLDVDACRMAELNYWRGRVKGTIAAKDELDQHAERARLIYHQANLAELDEKVRRGILLKAEDVIRDWENVFTAARAKLLSLPTKLVAESTVEDTTELMLSSERVVYDILNELATYELPEPIEQDVQGVESPDKADS